MSPIFGPPKEVKPKVAKTPTKKPTVKLAMCEAIVTLVNTAWQLSPWRDDALDETEQKALAKSLYNAAQVNVFLATVIVKLTTTTAEGQLVMAVGAIAVVRVAKRNQDNMAMLGIGALAQMSLQAMAGEDIVPPKEDSGVEVNPAMPKPPVEQYDQPIRNLSQSEGQALARSIPLDEAGASREFQVLNGDEEDGAFASHLSGSRRGRPRKDGLD